MAGGSSTVVARIGLDDTGFQEGVNKIQRSLKLVQSEFTAASAKLGDFGKSAEGLKLKADSLNQQIEIQRGKVEALSKSYQESVEKKGEDSKASENLKIKLNYANAELSKMQQELKDTSEELRKKTSVWNTLSEALDKAGDKMKAVGEKMQSVGKNLSTTVSLPILGIGTAATKMAMDAIESENLFEVSMGGLAGEARGWSEEMSKALGLNAYNVRSNVATYNAMLTSMGLASDESLGMSEGLTKLAYDMASFYNLSPDEAFNKLRAGISGEAEPLKALGILVNDNTIKTYAYTHGIAKQGEELTEAQKVQARYGVILDSTKNAQGDLARTMDSPTNKIRAMKEQAELIGIQFGQILIPILESLIGVVKPLMDSFQGLSKEQQEMIVKVALVAAAVGPVILVIGKVVSIVGAAVSAFSAVSGAISAAGGVIAIITGPIGIAVAAIGGLIAVGVLLYKNWDTVKAIGISVWNGVTNTVSTSINKARDAVKSAIDAIVGFFKNLKLPEFKLPQIKLPHFEIEGKFSLSPPQVPSFGIKWYREGGLMLDPTIFGFDGSSFLAGGESGTGGEAILPLNRLVPIMADAMRSLSVGRGDEFKEMIYLLRQIAAKKVDVYLDGRKLTSGLYDYFDELMTRSLADERLSRGGAY